MGRAAFLTLAALTTLAAPASATAADLHVPPPTAYNTCPPPAVMAEARAPLRSFGQIVLRKRGSWVQPPNVVTVEPFTGTVPGPDIYIAPQTAFLASSACPPSLGHAPGGSWYDGKVFYYNGTTPHRPDMFMVVVEPSTVRWWKRR